MAYTALYRKFRPLKFDDMVGQEHITTTLKNQMIADRVGHAYLFSGGRGTGKTSSAKILARAVNCLSMQDGEPCNECEICKGILAGTLTDVVEMDAASNNSVEDIRQIREEVNFLPAVAKYRVYIIDEVHMLSTGAFNALLKTLEEPPKHVKFFLATTEPQKLPATILSRCQRFDFKRISEDNLAKRLNVICKEDGIKISEQAINMIAILAEGGARDAISILERCIQEEAGSEIGEDAVRELAGVPKISYINNVVKNIVSGDVEKLLLALKEVIDDGKDLDNFLWETIKYVKDILVYKATKEIALYNQQEVADIASISKAVTKEKLFELIYTLSELANSIKWSSQKTIMLQVGLIKCCKAGAVESSEEIAVEIKDMPVASKPKNTESKELKDEEKEVASKAEVPQEQIPREETPKVPEQPKSVANTNYAEYWPKILDTLKTNGKIMLYTNLIGTKAKKADDMSVEIEFKGKITAFAKTVLEGHENKEELKKMVSLEEGQPMQIKYVENATSGAVIEKKNDAKLPNDIGININIIDA